MYEQQKQKNEKRTAMMVVLLIVAATAVIVAITTNPWNYIPTQVTENAEILAVIDAGCVVESKQGHSFVVPDCDSSVGDIVSVTFHVPGAELNEYYDRIQDKLETVDP
ncbi:MAG: hypothetical protein ACR2LL_10475 [Nitrosopumilus sp.]